MIPFPWTPELIAAFAGRGVVGLIPAAARLRPEPEEPEEQEDLAPDVCQGRTRPRHGTCHTAPPRGQE